MEKHLNPNFLVVETFKKNLGTMGHDKENSFLCLFIFIPFHSSMKNHCSRERNQKNSFSSLIFRKISLDIHYLDDVNLLILLLKFLSKCQHFLQFNFHRLLGCPIAKLRPLLRGSHFSECLYRRDLGQIRILGGNWHFRWG